VAQFWTTAGAGKKVQRGQKILTFAKIAPALPLSLSHPLNLHFGLILDHHDES
jgi:hypothetical protein